MNHDPSAQSTGTCADRPCAAVILAAGKSTRMKTDLPKVMHEICGRPMLAYVLDACRAAGITKFYLVVGFGKERIIEAFGRDSGMAFVEQREQKGTGHAVQMCADALRHFSGDLIVIAGDMPLIRSDTLRSLIDSHRTAKAAASIATTVLPNPAGYGRIIRDAAGHFERIVEHRDCTPEQLRISEVNPSYYCFDARALFEALPKLKADNAKGEYYITDVLGILRAAGQAVSAVTSVPAEDATGINSRVELAEVAKLMQQRIQRNWMDRGVTITDPDNTWIDSRATIGAEAVIRPFSYIEGGARIGARCRVGPFAYAADGTVLEDGAQLGPASLDAAGGLRGIGTPECRRSASASRRPPAQSGCP
jgi:bifunctional UDP-N-acetylglucosamine pyrophosphorylase / glucosamine-1-phosphate N-acetyltransferase